MNSSSANGFQVFHLHDSSHSRLNTPYVNGASAGAWVAGQNTVGEWIQVDFIEMQTVESVATQGRNKADTSQWVTSYKVTYRDDDNLPLSYVLDIDGNERVFVGNSDRDTVVVHILGSSVTARYFRLYPQSWNVHMSMRWELYACKLGEINSTMILD